MRFIHTGDVHLGMTPDVGYAWSDNRKEEIWSSFGDLIRRIAREKQDLLLISGDLFHYVPSVREMKEVRSLFSMIPDTQIIMIAGNHDPVSSEHSMAQFDWGENVIGLWGQSLQRVYISSCQTWVYGFSYYSHEIKEARYEDLHPGNEPGFHILLGHGGDAGHIPLHIEALKNAGFDYVALGHIHRPWLAKDSSIGYCGALEPTDRNDIGPHGYIQGELKSDGKNQSELIVSAKRSYVHHTIIVDFSTTQTALEQRVRQMIGVEGEQNIYRLYLEGKRDPDILFQTEALQKLGNIIDVFDDTEPAYDYETLQAQFAGSLLGDYIKCFAETEDECKKKALAYGVQALLSNE